MKLDGEAMANVLPVSPPFSQLLPLEQVVWSALRDAMGAQKRTISIAPAVDLDPTITAPFLRWLLLEAMPASQLPIKRFELQAETIPDLLDLAGTSLGILPRFVNCRFAAGIDLTDATIIRFDLISSDTTAILADRLTAGGSLVIRASGEGSSLRRSVVSEQIRLCGAKIRGNLDLRGCDLAAGRKPIPLFADGVVVEGNALLSDQFRAVGEVRLNGSHIHRNLDCSGASLCNKSGYSFTAAGARIDGSVYLCHTQPWVTYPDPIPFTSEGTLRLEGAKIDGDLDCGGGYFTATAFLVEDWKPESDSGTDLYAIEANGLEVRADLNLSEGFHAKGVITLIGATVGGDFICSSGFFDFPGEEPLVADGTTVSGTTFFSHGARTNGILRFVQASLQQGLEVDNAVFDVTGESHHWLPEENTYIPQLGGHACGFYAPSAVVRGMFLWQNVSKFSNGEPSKNPLWLYLFGARADAVEDDRSSWEVLDRFNVTDWVYGSISTLTGDIRWRIDQLDRQYATLNPLSSEKSNVLGSMMQSHGSSRSYSRYIC
jgi:hypothetical protein